MFDGCPIFAFPLAAGDNPDLEAEPVRWESRFIVLTQACDLANPRTTRSTVAVIRDAAELVDAGVVKAQTVRDQIRRHQVYGWYFLPESSVLQVNESLVDLHQLHTLPRNVLEKLIREGKRVCSLETPYREHLAQHFANTYARIGLPEPYETRST